MWLAQTMEFVNMSVSAELKHNIVDQAVNQWQPKLRVCIHASRQHFEQLLNSNSHTSSDYNFVTFSDRFAE